MKTPRDISGKELVKLLRAFGYEMVRQNGSHMVVTSNLQGEHHLAIPNHNPVKTGTLNSIISLVAQHFGITKEQVLRRILS